MVCLYVKKQILFKELYAQADLLDPLELLNPQNNWNTKNKVTEIPTVPYSQPVLNYGCWGIDGSPTWDDLKGDLGQSRI